MKRSERRLVIGTMVGMFALGLFLQSCNSATNSPVAASDTTPLVSASSQYVNGLLVPDFSLAGTGLDDVAMNPPDNRGDSTGKGGGRDTTVKGGGRDSSDKGNPNNSTVRFKRLPIPCLGLDSAQMEVVKHLMENAATATRAANDAYRQAMEPIRAADKAAMDAYYASTKGIQDQLKEMQAKYRQQASDIMAQVKAGTMTRDEAKAALDALRTQFRNDTQALRAQLDAARQALKQALSANNDARRAANSAYQAALKQIQDELYAGIEAILTPEQLIKWRLWLSGGDPCKGTGIRK